MWFMVRIINCGEAKNGKEVVLKEEINHLSKTLTFRIGSGFSERIIYRELFPFGLTLLDVMENQAIIKITAMI